MSLGGFAFVANAAPAAPPVSGDDRAIAIPNDRGITTCASADLPGVDVTAVLEAHKGAVEIKDNTYITFTTEAGKVEVLATHAMLGLYRLERYVIQ